MFKSKSNMSKSTSPSGSSPPPYSESITTPPPPSQFPHPQTFTYEKPNPISYLAAHLTNLPRLIRESQEAHHTTRTASDLALISLLIPHIENLLHQFATRPSLPPLAELTIVPAAAVPADWLFANASASARSSTSRPDGEIHELVRVEVDKETAEKLRLDQANCDFAVAAAEESSGVNRSNPWQTREEFDDWGRWGEDLDGGLTARKPPDWLWWQDEELAKRLARHLQPRAPPPRQAPPPPAAPVAGPAVLTKEPPKQSRWAMFKSPDPLEPAPKPGPFQGLRRRSTLPVEEAVIMTVRPEEVTFRRENEFGIWESKNGYGLVVRVRTRR